MAGKQEVDTGCHTSAWGFTGNAVSLVPAAASAGCLRLLILGRPPWGDTSVEVCSVSQADGKQVGEG